LGTTSNNLYVSFKRADGSWTEPASLDQGINTDELDIYPYVTPDGKYLIFTRREYAEVAHFSRLYWVSAAALEGARQQQLAPSFRTPIPVFSKIDPRCLGTYADASWKFKIASVRTLAGEVLTAEINGDPGNTLFLERLGNDAFWSHGLWFRFDPGSGQLRIQNDRSGSPERGFAKIP
jgi:WD40-like Beta Propeller Repeat